MKTLGIFLAALPLSLAACGEPTPVAPPPPKSIQGLLKIDSAQVRISDSRMPQVSVDIVGQLPDACTKVMVGETRNGYLFKLRVITDQPVGPCIQSIPPP